MLGWGACGTADGLGAVSWMRGGGAGKGAAGAAARGDGAAVGSSRAAGPVGSGGPGGCSDVRNGCGIWMREDARPVVRGLTSGEGVRLRGDFGAALVAPVRGGDFVGVAAGDLGCERGERGVREGVGRGDLERRVRLGLGWAVVARDWGLVGGDGQATAWWEDSAAGACPGGFVPCMMLLPA